MFEWVLSHPILAGSILAPIIGLIIDIVLGLIPDKWLSYVGGFRWFIGKMIEVLETLPQTSKVKAALWLLEKIEKGLSK